MHFNTMYVLSMEDQLDIFTSVCHISKLSGFHTCVILGSESDSTEEPVVGNVNKFAVVPPGYNGRPKKGHLIFDACFECGKNG